MTDNLRESISALMDDEASELEIHRLLSNKESDGEVRNTWKRYQLASFAMKGQLSKHIDVDISQRVAEALAEETITPEALPAAGKSGWRKVARPVTSVAVAASVAFLVVFGTLQINQPTSDPVAMDLAQGASTPGDSKQLASVADTNVLAVGADSMTPAQKKLRALIDSHTQQADISRGRAFMPYAQLVSDGDSQRY